MLYLANPSRQNHIFLYREPVNNLLQQAHIPSGGQTAIGRNWTAEQKGKVITQLELFGARDAAEAHGRMTKFLGLVYRDMGQIETGEIETAHEAEMGAREDRTASAAVKGALAFDKTARRETDGRPKARVTETTVEQELPRGQRKKGGEVAFNLAVDPENGRSDVRLPIN